MRYRTRSRSRSLTHTSGLRNGALVNRLAFTGQIDQREIDNVFAEGTTFNDANFGKYNYTNLGYNIYGLALHYHLNKKWQDLLQERIFAPAGLKHTTAYVSKARAKKFKIAAPYVISTDGSDAGKMVRSGLEKTDENMQSAGGIFMSISDLGRWLNLNMNGGKLDGKQVVPADLSAKRKQDTQRARATSRHSRAMANTGSGGKSASIATRRWSIIMAAIPVIAAMSHSCLTKRSPSVSW